MIDTEDLDSYYSGYDEYCEPKEQFEKYDYSERRLKKWKEKLLI